MMLTELAAEYRRGAAQIKNRLNELGAMMKSGQLSETEKLLLRGRIRLLSSMAREMTERLKGHMNVSWADQTITFAQIANFLFKPQSLSIPFLLIFIALLIFGVWLFKRCVDKLDEFKANAESMYEPVSNKMSPDAFIRSTVEKSSAREGVLENIPDAFVSIGILATFIGLGLALQDATDLLKVDVSEVEQSTRKLSELLGIIAFKFQTSVWGIFFSLVFKRFVVEKYFEHRQEVIDYVRELLYRKERDGIRTLIEKQNVFFEQQFEYQKQLESDHQNQIQQFASTIESKFLESTALFVAKMQELMSAQAAAHSELMAQQLKNHREQLILAANNNKALVDLITKNNTALLERQDKIVAEFVEIHKGLVEYVNTTKLFVAASAQFTKNTTAFIGCVNDYRQSVDAFKAELNQTLENESARLNGTLEKSSEQLKTAVETIGDRQFDTLCEMKRGIEDMQRIFLRDEDRFVEEIRRKLSTMLDDTGSRFKESLDLSIGKVSNDYNSVLETFNTNFNASLKKAHADYSASIGRFVDIADGVEKMLAGLDGTARQQLDNVSAIYDRMNELVKNIETVNSAALKEQNETLKNFSDSFVSTVNMMRTEQREELDARTAKLNAVFDAIEGIAKTVGTEQIKLLTDGQLQLAEEMKNGRLQIVEGLKKDQRQLVDEISSGQMLIVEVMRKDQRQLVEEISSGQMQFLEEMHEGQRQLLEVFKKDQQSITEEITKVRVDVEKLPLLQDLISTLSKILSVRLQPVPALPRPTAPPRRLDKS